MASLKKLFPWGPGVQTDSYPVVTFVPQKNLKRESRHAKACGKEGKKSLLADNEFKDVSYFPAKNNNLLERQIHRAFYPKLFGSVNTSIPTQTKWAESNWKKTQLTRLRNYNSFEKSRIWDLHNCYKHHESLSCKAKQKFTVMEKATDRTDIDLAVLRQMSNILERDLIQPWLICARTFRNVLFIM